MDMAMKIFSILIPLAFADKNSHELNCTKRFLNVVALSIFTAIYRFYSEWLLCTRTMLFYH